MANIKTRTLTSPTDPGSSSAKGSALTHSEMDSNLLLLNNKKLENTTDDFTGDLSIKGSGGSATGAVRLYDNDDSNYLDIKAPATIGSNYTLTLPTTDGDSGQVLTTDGSGTLTWTAKTVATTDLVSDTTPQLGGDLDTQAFALTGTDVLPSTGSYGGQATGTGGGVRLHTTGSDALIRTQQTGGKSNIVFVTDIDGSHGAGNSGSGLIYAPLNMQVRDDGHPTKTRTTFDMGVPYRGGTGATITQGSVTGKLLDVVAADRKIYLQGVSGGSFATSTATTGKVTGTVTAVNSIGTNAVELTYDTDFASTAATTDLADLGFARFSARDVLNTRGMRTSEPELHFEGGRIAFESNGTKMLDITDSGNIQLDISTGQVLSPFGGFLSDPSNQVEIKGGRYGAGLRVYDASVGDGTKAGFQLDPFHFDKYLGNPEKKGGQFSIQLFGEGLPKEAYSNFTEGSATGVHQKFEIKDNSDYYQTTVNVANGDATVTDANTGTITGVSGSSGGNTATKSGSTPFSDLAVGNEVTITGAGSGGANLVTTITDINDDQDELTLADNIETTVSSVSMTFNSGVFRRMTAGDIIRIEGAVSDSAGFAMSGNLVSKISQVNTGNTSVELDLTSSQQNDIITGSSKNATVVLNSSTAIRMSAGTTDATHTFTHKSEQNGTGLASNDRVDLKFEAKKITFQAGTDSSNISAIQAESDKVQMLDNKVKLTESSGNIKVETTGSNKHIVFKPDQTGATGNAGPEAGYSGWGGGAFHLNGVQSIEAGTDTPSTDLLFNTGLQITGKSDDDHSGPNFPTLAIKSFDGEGSVTSGSDNRDTGGQGYGNIWFQRYNKDADDSSIDAVENGQVLGGFFGGGSITNLGWYNADFSSTASATCGMFMRATDDWTTSAFPTRMEFHSTPPGSKNKQSVLDINGDKIVVNPTNLDVDFQVDGDTNDAILKVDAGTEVVSTGGVFQVYSASSDPSSNLAEGQMYFNSSTKKFMGYNGTSWVVIGSQS